MAIQRAGTSESSLMIHQSGNAQNYKTARVGKDNDRQLKSGSININELDGKLDSILSRKQRAQKKALKVVGDAWAADKKFDLDLKERRNHMQELQNTLSENKEQLQNCNASMEELKEAYGIEEDSQEQKDLGLMRLWNQHKVESLLSKSKEEWEERTGISLTEEDWQRMTEFKGQPNTEYQRRALEIDEEANFFQKNIDDAQIEIEAEDMSIRSIKIERLKDHSMVDAQKEADEINAEASKEIIGMLIDEAQDHIDETLEEKREEAKKKAEEKEEQEEKLEEQKVEKEQQQAQLEIEREENRVEEESKVEQRRKARKQAELLTEVGENLIQPSSNASEAQLAIKEMLNRMKLLEEDLKGAKIDEKVD